MRYSLSIAETLEDRERLYRFRYAIYVEEMRRPQKYADHDRMRIIDPLDECGHNIIATGERGDIVGCVRVNFTKDGGIDYYERLLDMSAVGANHPSKTSLCTRMMVAESHRRSLLATKLSCACFQLGLDHGIRWSFVDCNDHLVGFFERLGYLRTHRPVHDEYGQVNAMRMDLHAVDHLKAVGSPFAKIAHAAISTSEAAE